MRKRDVISQTDTIPFTGSQCCRTPLANAVQCQDGRPLKGTGEERTGGVTFVMVCEDQARHIPAAKAFPQRAAHVQLVF